MRTNHDWRSVASAPDWELRPLSEGERDTVARLVEALLCKMNADGVLEPPDSAWVARVVDDYDRMIGQAGKAVRFGIGGALRAVQRASWVLLRTRRTFENLTLSERVELLEKMESHDDALVTMVFVALKVPMLMPAFESGLALAETGFDRPTISARRRLPQLNQEPS